MSNYQKILPNLFRKVIWWRKLNGGGLESNKVKAGFTTWFINQVTFSVGIDVNFNISDNLLWHSEPHILLFRRPITTPPEAEKESWKVVEFQVAFKKATKCDYIHVVIDNYFLLTFSSLIFNIFPNPISPSCPLALSSITLKTSFLFFFSFFFCLRKKKPLFSV